MIIKLVQWRLHLFGVAYVIQFWLSLVGLRITLFGHKKILIFFLNILMGIVFYFVLLQ